MFAGINNGNRPALTKTNSFDEVLSANSRDCQTPIRPNQFSPHSRQTLNTIGEILNRKQSVGRMMSKTAEGLAHSFEFRHASPEDLVFDLFRLPQREEASIGKLISVLRSFGLRDDDPRLRPTMEKIREFDMMNEEDNDVRHYCLNRQQFRECVHPCISLISQALRNQLIIPNWGEFTAKIRTIFEECRRTMDGHVATYIPQLARQDPDQWGMSICTIDGQRFSLGDSKCPFCVQSVSKAFNYAIVASDLGADYVHSFVGHEPSGRLFNEICLDPNGKPHNPLINAGAIIVTSLLKKGLPMADRYDFAYNEYRKLAGGGYVGFNNATFLSERYSADRNYALSYYMKENKCFPPGIQSLREELEFYFQLCSLETHCESASAMAATLANGGVCPITNERCIDSRPCRDVLSLMYSCGMYDYSGQFAFHVGLPAKSGVSGALIVVVPNLMGICLWSPPLDKMGNSSRGVLFCQKLIETFNFHNYDSLLHADSKKIDPRRRLGNKETDLIVALLFSCKNGDLETIRRLYLQGVNMNIADYDGRTALHLAACEGHVVIMKFLLKVVKVDFAIQDRWGRTALDDARLFGHTKCVRLLLKAAHDRKRKTTTSASSRVGKAEKRGAKEGGSDLNNNNEEDGKRKSGGNEEPIAAEKGTTEVEPKEIMNGGAAMDALTRHSADDQHDQRVERELRNSAFNGSITADDDEDDLLDDMVLNTDEEGPLDEVEGRKLPRKHDDHLFDSSALNGLGHQFGVDLSVRSAAAVAPIPSTCCSSNGDDENDDEEMRCGIMMMNGREEDGEECDGLQAMTAHHNNHHHHPLTHDDKELKGSLDRLSMSVDEDRILQDFQHVKINSSGGCAPPSLTTMLAANSFQETNHNNMTVNGAGDGVNASEDGARGAKNSKTNGREGGSSERR